MLRKLSFDGKYIVERDVVVGNHGPAKLTVRGDFSIAGLIYCPKYSLEIVVQGNGILTLRGVCRRLIIKRVTGKAVMELEELKITELVCQDLSGTSELKIAQPKYIISRNVGANAKLHIMDRQSLCAID
jgi:hypothetical protein